MGRLDGKSVVITGAASGIGEATARLFCREGAAVVLADVDNARGERIASELGQRARYVHADVSQDGATAGAVQVAVDAFGGLDCLFNNAGNAGSAGGITEIELASFDRTVAVHLRGVFLGIQAAAKVMRPQGHGSIINTASVAGFAANLAGHDYSACKAAIMQLTRTTANELAEHNVRVNAVAPGAIATAIWGRAAGLEGEQAQRAAEFMKTALSDAAPMPRSGLPDDVAELVLWLASDASAYVTGQVIGVDGGLLTGSVRRHRQVQPEVLLDLIRRAGTADPG